MRNIFFKTAVCLITAIISFSLSASQREWKDAPGGLPYYKYTGSSDADPSFLIGNSHIKVKTHLDGIYEMISGERCWARFNADPVRPDYGKNRATVYLNKKRINLVGPGSLATVPGKCEVYSGAGFVRYDYDLGNGIKCSRMISVMPSQTPADTAPLFLVTLTFENTGSAARNLSYEEALSPYFVQASHQLIPEAERPLRYNMSTDISFRCIKASFGPVPQGFVPLAVPQNRAKDEFAPQSIFLYSANAFLVVNEGELKASIEDFKIRARKKHTFHIVIGFSGDNNKGLAEAVIKKAEDSQFGAFSSMWKKHLPDFSAEKNKDVRNELYRSAYSIEASMVYSDYFKETFIPGKFLYASRFGENISNSDHINAALQACYTNPSLAKSIIRYVMKQTSFDGMIPDSNKGFGYISSDQYTHNLTQLEVLNVLAEYLMRTGDYEFLDEWLTVYPMERGEVQSVKSIIERYFIYIRDKAYVSATMSSMQTAVLPKFLDQMKKSGKLSAEFIDAFQKYTDKAVEHLNSRNEYASADIQYLLESKLLTNSQKRDILDEAVNKGSVDMRAIPGLSSFDGIEASSLFRTLILKNDASDDADIMDAWTIYSYFRIKE